jgi:hypothetical protein
MSSIQDDNDGILMADDDPQGINGINVYFSKIQSHLVIVMGF